MKKVILVVWAMTAFATGCVTRPAAPPPVPALEFLQHKVAYPGETLGQIARWYTGSAANWQLIAEANPGLNPQRIRTGETIRIPRALVVKDTPLPRPARREAASVAAGAPAADGEVKDIPLQPVAVEPAVSPQAPSADAVEDRETVDLLEQMQKEREAAQPTPEAELPSGQKSRDEFLKEMLDEALEE